MLQSKVPLNSMRKNMLNFFQGRNYLIILLFLILFLVAVIIVAKSFLTTPTYIYAKVKVGQGLWWANTSKPPIWYVNSMVEGDEARNLLGSFNAKILSKRYYHYYGSDQFDIYLVVKLKATHSRNGEYSFNRSTISVGSPIEMQFPKVDITGSVIDLSLEPISDKLETKTIYFSKRNAYPWELSAIHVGDKYFDGKDIIFEVEDVSGIDTTNLSSDVFGNSTASISEPTKYIAVKAKAKMKQVNGQWILGEDHLIIPGKVINIDTSNFSFDNYIVISVQ